MSNLPGQLKYILKKKPPHRLGRSDTEPMPFVSARAGRDGGKGVVSLWA